MINLKNLKKNEIYKLLIKNKLIKNKNLSVFSYQTRDDKNLKSFIDKTTNIIFLQKIKTENFYKNKNTHKKDEKMIKTSDGKLKVHLLKDSLRIIKQFKKNIKN